MDTGSGDSSSYPGRTDDVAELAALDAEIARLSLRRDQLRARLASSATGDLAAPATSSAKAGWYPDPFGRFPWRYWSGTEWTGSVGRNGMTYQDPPVWNTATGSTSSSDSATQVTQTAPTLSGQSAPSEAVSQPAQSVPSYATWSQESTPPKPARTRPDIDIGKLILILGAALLIGGLAGLTVWLWAKVGNVGRLGILGVATVLQVGVALRLRGRLQAAAEAFATTGAATLLFAVGAVSLEGAWDGTVGVVVGLVGVALLFFAQFRAWVIAGHLAIAVGATAVIVAEPWPQTALIVAAVIGLVRVISTKPQVSFRPDDVAVFPAGLTASALAALLAAPVLAWFQSEAVAVAVVFTLVALAVSEFVVRSRTSPIERDLSQVAGTLVAIGGVAWSASLWPNGDRPDGLVGLWVTGLVAALLWRVARTEEAARPALMTLAVGLVPFAVRFATDAASDSELIIFCAVMAVAGVVVARFIERPLPLSFWASAVIASVAANGQLALWPRLALATVAFVSVAQFTKADGLRYVAAGTATATVADLLYGGTFEVSWWFRPDLIGAAAAVFLFAAVRTRSTPPKLLIESWEVPRYWESSVALLAVPVAAVVSQPALADLGSESLWRLGLVGAVLVGSWAYGAVRRTRPNALQLVSLVAAIVVTVSRVGDESAAVRTGAWAIIGCVVTILLSWIAVTKKVDELRYVAAGTATGTVAILLYGDLFEVSWWFRPDLIGVAAAVFLYVAVRTRVTPQVLRLGSWEVPRYWESAVALLAVPVAAVVSQPALADLGSESLWRIGFVGAMLVGSWAYGAVRRARPNALQLVSLVAAFVMTVSRVGDESAAVRTGAWAVIGCLATIVLAWLGTARKVDELLYLAAGTATGTVAILLYGELFEVSWWFRPDVVGVAAAGSLVVANRRQSTPWSASVGSWEIPRYWEAVVALLAVPVAEPVSRPAFGDLSSESVWRLGFVGAVLVGSWAYGAVRRARPNAVQVVSLLATVVVIVSRVGDESAAVRTGAWAIIGCVVTILLSWTAVTKKLDDLRYVAAGTATGTVAALLYGELFEVSWWFRPDVVGVAAAVFLYAAVRTRVTPRVVRVGGQDVPRYWESAVALLVVPVAKVVSLPAFGDLTSESVWRLGFVGAVLVGSWAYGAVRRTRPNALQVVSLLAATVVMVSRVADESDAMRAAGWVVIGGLFVGAALVFRRVELLVPAAGSWMLVVYLYSPPGPLEVLTCSLAAVAGVIAWLARRFGRTGTLDFIPATALAIIPSAFAAAGAVLDGTVDSEQVTRIVLVLVVGAAALAIGTYRRFAALVGPSAVALVALAVAQLIVVQRSTSGWVSALVAGVVLLIVGTRLEYLRSMSRRAGDLVRSLR